MNHKNTSFPPHCALCSQLGTSVFCQLGVKSLDELAARKSFVSFNPGEIIIEKGTIPKGVYCLCTGEIGVYRPDHLGEDKLAYTVSAGHLIGYRSILNEKPYPHVVSAVDECTLCFIPRADFMELAENNIRLSGKLIQMLSDELGQAENDIIRMVRRPATERLAEALLIRWKACGTPAIGSWQGLPDLTGISKEHALELLHQFAAESLIDFNGKSITITDADQLGNRYVHN